MKSFLFTICSLLSFNSIESQTWIRQNPYPQLAELQDIDFDDLNGIAVGTESTIFTTSNGGINWIPRNAPQSGSYFQAALVVPGTNGQLMFAGGYQLIVSRNGGITWNYTSAPTELVYKIQVLPNGSILVLDSNKGFISDDEGASWVQFTLPGMNTSAGHFTSELNGWVVQGGFDNNQVWVTTDGGNTWAIRDPLKHPVVSEIFMTDNLNGFLGSRDFVYKTVDGGQSWVQMNPDPVNSIRDMHVVNENEIWTCLTNGFIFYTLNGGITWDQINPNIISSNRTNGIFATEEGKVWATGKYVSIMYTSNSGIHWTDQIPNAKGIMYEPHFINENVGIIGSSEGTILKTTNGGASFEKMLLGPDEYFFAVQMISEQQMIAGSSSGTIFESSDQGESWNQIGENLGQIKDIYAFNPQSMVLTNESGKIYKTINGGMLWNEVYTGNSDLLLGLDFVNSQEGWACGWFGQILHTEDGGSNWTSQLHDGYHQFADIHFTSATEGWVISSNFADTIWHTTNGGVNWEPSLLPTKTYWQKVSFCNADTGWIAGGSAGYGIILRTNDGGLSWSVDHTAPEAFFGLYALPGKETAWATGFGGNIEKYSPCTFNPQLSNLTGDQMPCQRDTSLYTVTSSGVDIFEWSFPPDWLIFGNPNTSSVQVIVGALPGEVGISGKDACGNTTLTLSLATNPISVEQASISENNGELTSNFDTGLHQWFRNGIPISGATQQSYTPIFSGLYEVVITNLATGCETRSNSIEIFISGVRIVENEELLIFPNPASDILNFGRDKGGEIPADASVSIITHDGRIIYRGDASKKSLDISDFPQSLFVLRVQKDSQIFQKVFLKIEPN